MTALPPTPFCSANHSVDYRSAMAFERAHLIEDLEKARAGHDGRSLFPGRTAPPGCASTTQEIKAAAVVSMEIRAGLGEDPHPGCCGR
ncbi:hypothetical protein [Methylobacterium crusticola]|uniref:hypothetical protein n=1 Tax=Methylobacterium crusticola TaxID=1697972 RepID=UPI00193A7F6D|nr:hypothetical protein [Methylobacterium crusticola]